MKIHHSDSVAISAPRDSKSLPISLRTKVLHSSLVSPFDKTLVALEAQTEAPARDMEESLRFNKKKKRKDFIGDADDDVSTTTHCRK